VGSIRDIIEICDRPLNEKQIGYTIAQTLRGLVYLHEQCHVIHRDVKCGNILFNSEIQAKLVDFGMVFFREFGCFVFSPLLSHTHTLSLLNSLELSLLNSLELS
jgi:serine/threonine protein kinase